MLPKNLSRDGHHDLKKMAAHCIARFRKYRLVCVYSQSWQTLQQAEVAVPSMMGICTSLAESWEQWQDWRSDASSHRAPLPMGWEEKLNRFQKMIVVRTLAEVSGNKTIITSVLRTTIVGAQRLTPLAPL